MDRDVRSVFSWVVDDSGGAVKVTLGTATFTVPTREVRDLAMFVLMLRARMVPALPATPEDADFRETFVADEYAVRCAPGSTTAHLWARVPGVGWIDMAFSQEQLRDMALLVPTQVSTGSVPAAARLH